MGYFHKLSNYSGNNPGNTGNRRYERIFGLHPVPGLTGLHLVNSFSLGIIHAMTGVHS